MCARRRARGAARGAAGAAAAALHHYLVGRRRCTRLRAWVLESVWASLLCPAIGVMVIAALLTTLAFFLATVKAIDNGLGLTPPRGWRSCKPFFLSVSNSAASSSLVCIFLDLVSGGCCCALLLPSLSSSAHRVRCRTQQLTAAPPASCLLPPRRAPPCTRRECVHVYRQQQYLTCGR
jgi:hypothetical protein